MKKTLAEHLEFVESFAKLSFYFTYRLASVRPEESLDFILRQRSPLYRTVLNLNPDDDIEVFRHFPDASNASEFEEKMWLQCRDYVLKRAAENYPESVGVALHDGWQAECFKFDPPSANSPQRCKFHIRNTKAPESIFSYPDYVIEHLLLLLDLMERTCGVTELGTGSWLNSNPYWLRFFPPSWMEHMVDRPAVPRNHLGYWGQIITARGTFNEKNAGYVRENLTMRYPSRYSWCTIQNLRTHLKKLQPESLK